MTALRSKVLLLGIEVLDWAVLQLLMDKGYLPTFQQLMNSGSAGPFSSPAQMTGSAFWNTLLTGVDETMHGILTDLEPGPAGLSARAVSASRVRVPRLWDYAEQAQLGANVMGWPALAPVVPRPGITVANGIQYAEPGVYDLWPLPPATVFPPAWRESVLDMRVLADDIPEQALLALLQALPEPSLSRVTLPSRLLFSQLLSLHAIGLQMAEDPAYPWHLLALRLDTFSAIHAVPGNIQLSTHPVEYLLGWYQFLDSMLAKYLSLLGPQDALVLVSRRGMDQKLMGRAANPQQAVGDGVLMMRGPQVPADAVMPPVALQDIAPTVLSMLGLKPHARLPGQAWFSPAADRIPLAVPAAWPEPLTEVGEAPAQATEDFVHWSEDDKRRLSEMEHIARQVHEEAAFHLARAEFTLGRYQQCAQHLRALLHQASALTAPGLVLQGCVLLCKCLLILGETSECVQLVERYRVKEAGRVWNTTIDGMLAFALADWPSAAQHFRQLLAHADSPVNAPLWLAESLIAQGQFTEAHSWLQLATTDSPLEIDRAWDSLAGLHMRQGRWPDALQAINQAIAYRPSDAPLLLKRFEIHVALGARTQAESDLHRVRQLAPALISEQQANQCLIRHFKPDAETGLALFKF